MLVEERVGFEIRSSVLETGLSSRDNPIEVEVDTTASVSSSSLSSSLKTTLTKIKAFRALKEKCTLDKDPLFRF